MSAATRAILTPPAYLVIRRGLRGNLHAALPTLNASGYLTVCGRRLTGLDLHPWAGEEAHAELGRTARHCPRCRTIGDQVPS